MRHIAISKSSLGVLIELYYNKVPLKPLENFHITRTSHIYRKYSYDKFK